MSAAANNPAKDGQRANLFGRIRDALGADANRADYEDGRIRAVADRLGFHPRGPQPARSVGAGEHDEAHRHRLFVAKAFEAAATVELLASRAELPQAIARYLRQNNLPPRLRLAPGAGLDALDWASTPMLEISSGASDGSDPASLTTPFAAIAETGTLMLVSGETSPVTLAFLPETHFVLMRKDQIAGTLEAAFDRLRAAHGNTMPRAINFVTGPSRSADIEQTLQMGAHGPKRLHILLVDE
ncbi:MAG: lactate utilization protein [Dongiaceae bacterium]